MSRNYSILMILGFSAGILFFFPACKSVKLLTRKPLAPIPFEQLYQKLKKSTPLFLTSAQN